MKYLLRSLVYAFINLIVIVPLCAQEDTTVTIEPFQQLPVATNLQEVVDKMPHWPSMLHDTPPRIEVMLLIDTLGNVMKYKFDAPFDTLTAYAIEPYLSEITFLPARDAQGLLAKCWVRIPFQFTDFPKTDKRRKKKRRKKSKS